MHAPPSGLHKDAYERDSCGFGLIASLDDAPSHWLVRTAMTSLNRLTHRGAIAADGKTGDGCGLLLKNPEAFLRAVAAEAGVELGARFASGLVFLSHDAQQAGAARLALATELTRQGLEGAGWRAVPVDPSACGAEALKTRPLIEQLFVNCRCADIDEAAFNRRLFMARRLTEKALHADPVFYVPSLSASTIVFKGMVMPQYLAQFYPDLADPRLESSVAVFHQRFSTNTLPQWRLAHPYRYLAHNGEINTIQGNRNWATARGPLLRSPLLPALQEALPLVSMSGSDSQSLDNMLEVLLMGGLDPLHAMRLLVPPARPGCPRPGSARLLRVLLGAHGAVGRPGRGGADRRPLCAVHAGSQRPAPRALLHHPQPCSHHCLRDRRVGLPARGRGAQGQARSRRHGRARPAHRHPARLGGHRSDPQDPPSLQELAPPGRAVSGERSGGCAARGRAHGSRHAVAVSEDVQCHAGGARRHHPRAGAGRERSGGLDGRRHAHAGAVAHGALAVRLLPPAVRPGDQSAHRQLARIDRDVAADADRSGVQHLRARARTRAPDRARLADPLTEEAPPDPGDRGGHARISRPAVRARGGPAPGDRAPVRAGGERGARGEAGAAAVGSLSRQGAHSRARAAGDGSGASASAEDRPALQVQPAHRDRHRARAASLRLPDRLWSDRRVSVHGVPGVVRDDAPGTRQARLRGAPRTRAQLPCGPETRT